MFTDCEEIEVDVKTLDSLGMPSPQLLKIDTQGAECAILEGGSATLRDTRYIIMEVVERGVVYNLDSPTHDEVLAFMESIGFVKDKFINEISFEGNRVQSDWLFKRKDSVYA